MTTSTLLAGVFPDGQFTADCPTRVVLAHVTGKWAPLVLTALSDGEPLRWSELRRRVQGVSEKMLAQVLRTLEDDGLVHRDARPVVPPHVEYSLTGPGTELVARLLPLMTWIAEHVGELGASTR